jgi:hypothetical protein
MGYFLLEKVPGCRASVLRFEDPQNLGADLGLEWKKSLVAGRQRRGLLITNSLTRAGRLYYIKAFFAVALNGPQLVVDWQFAGPGKLIKRQLKRIAVVVSCDTCSDFVQSL